MGGSPEAAQFSFLWCWGADYGGPVQNPRTLLCPSYPILQGVVCLQALEAAPVPRAWHDPFGLLVQEHCPELTALERLLERAVACHVSHQRGDFPSSLVRAAWGWLVTPLGKVVEVWRGTDRSSAQCSATGKGHVGGCCCWLRTAGWTCSLSVSTPGLRSLGVRAGQEEK